MYQNGDQQDLVGKCLIKLMIHRQKSAKRSHCSTLLFSRLSLTQSSLHLEPRTFSYIGSHPFITAARWHSLAKFTFLNVSAFSIGSFVTVMHFIGPSAKTDDLTNEIALCLDCKKQHVFFRIFTIRKHNAEFTPNPTRSEAKQYLFVLSCCLHAHADCMIENVRKFASLYIASCFTPCKLGIIQH